MSSRRFVFAVCALAFASGARAEVPASVSITQVASTLDRFPGPSFVQPDVHVAVDVRLQNLTNGPVAIRVDHAYTSYDASLQGSELKKIAVSDRKLCGADQCSEFTLPAGSKFDAIQILGNGVSPAGQGRKIFVTLMLTVGQEHIVLHGIGDVLSAD